MSLLPAVALLLALDASAAKADSLPASDLLTLPVSAIVAGAEDGAVEKSYVAESVAALQQKRGFSPGEPDASVSWDTMSELPDLKDKVEGKDSCGGYRNVRDLTPTSLRGAATLIYLQRKSALAFADREHKAASAYLKAASAAAAANARATSGRSNIAIEAAEKEEKLRLAVKSLRTEVSAMEGILLANGWADEEKPLRSAMGLGGEARRLVLRAKAELDYTYQIRGRC